MPYRCPVCSSPEVDGTHLANHLAFTAVIRGDDHEDWLDEHAPGWDEENPETLAPKVTEAVPEVEIPELDGEEHEGHEHGPRLEDELANQGSHRGPGAAGGESSAGRGDLTDEASGVMAEAREMTKEMYGLDESTADGDDADAEDDVDAADAGNASDAEGESTADATAADDASESETE